MYSLASRTQPTAKKQPQKASNIKRVRSARKVAYSTGAKPRLSFLIRRETRRRFIDFKVQGKFRQARAGFAA
jgi:hypothetical protein